MLWKYFVECYQEDLEIMYLNWVPVDNSGNKITSFENFIFFAYENSILLR